MINILYATKVNIGGWATFTRHLHDLLKAAGHPVRIVKLGNRTEHFSRPFGSAHVYHNMTIDDLYKQTHGNATIIAALGKHYIEEAEHLMTRRARMVVHDTAEAAFRMKLDKPWCIRKTLAAQVKGGVFMRHPYVRHSRAQIGAASAIASGARKGIFATSRVDFDKNTTMILDANRLGAKINIVGFENRLYTKFKVMPHYPEWEQSPGTHPRTGAGSFELLLGARAMVDLTNIKCDGGGTQYTFLEAWDAGVVPIIGRWWLKKKDDMVEDVNCVAVDDAKSLAALAKRVNGNSFEDDGLVRSIIDMGERSLKRHAPKVLAPQIMEWLYAR